MHHPNTRVMQRPISFFTRQGCHSSRDQDNNKANIERGNDTTLFPATADPSSCSYPKLIMSRSECISFGHYNDFALDNDGATPNADELSSFSSNPNSLEASWNGSSYPYRSETHHGYHHQQQQPKQSFSNHHNLSHRHVLTPPSPSREHVPKRPRFAVDGMNVVESLIHNIFSSCGCVSSTTAVSHQHQKQQDAHRQHPPSLKPPFSTLHGFASRPLGFKSHHNSSNYPIHQPHDEQQQYGSKMYHSYPATMINNMSSFALPDPPKVRRLTMTDASKNDLDVAFLLHEM